MSFVKDKKCLLSFVTWCPCHLSFLRFAHVILSFLKIHHVTLSNLGVWGPTGLPVLFSLEVFLTSDNQVWWPKLWSLICNLYICFTIWLSGRFWILSQYFTVLVIILTDRWYSPSSPRTAAVEVCCLTCKSDFMYFNWNLSTESFKFWLRCHAPISRELPGLNT